MKTRCYAAWCQVVSLSCDLTPAAWSLARGGQEELLREHLQSLLRGARATLAALDAYDNLSARSAPCEHCGDDLLPDELCPCRSE